jgi:hypothetical protein
MKKVKSSFWFSVVVVAALVCFGCISDNQKKTDLLAGASVSSPQDSDLLRILEGGGEWKGDWKNWDVPGSSVSTLRFVPQRRGGKLLEYAWGDSKEFNLKQGQIYLDKDNFKISGNKLRFQARPGRVFEFSYDKKKGELRGRILNCPRDYIVMTMTPEKKNVPSALGSGSTKTSSM